MYWFLGVFQFQNFYTSEKVNIGDLNYFCLYFFFHTVFFHCPLRPILTFYFIFIFVFSVSSFALSVDTSFKSRKKASLGSDEITLFKKKKKKIYIYICMYDTNSSHQMTYALKVIVLLF